MVETTEAIQLPDKQSGNAPTVLAWYDFLCPFCYVGQHRTAMLLRHGVHVVELPFQIHPEIPPGGMIAGPRHGPMYATLEREAKEAGLVLRWPARLPDTRRALAAAEWVRRNQPGAFRQLHEELFEAHFALGENLEDPAVIDRHAGDSFSGGRDGYRGVGSCDVSLDDTGPARRSIDLEGKSNRGADQRGDPLRNRHLIRAENPVGSPFRSGNWRLSDGGPRSHENTSRAGRTHVSCPDRKMSFCRSVFEPAAAQRSHGNGKRA
jgi:hypothetical protein